MEKIDYKNAELEITNSIRGIVSGREMYFDTLGIAAILNYTNSYDENYNNVIELLDGNIEDESTRYFLKTVYKKYNNIVDQYTNRFESNELISLMLNLRINDFRDYETPDSLCMCANEILEIKNDDKVLDLCFGLGRFLLNSYKENDQASYFGIEKNAQYITAIKLINSVLGLGLELRQENVLAADFTNNKYDKVFSNFPFGVRIQNIKEEFLKNKKLMGLERYIKNSGTADWIYNAKVMEALKDNGRAVSIVASGALFNISDSKIRSFFVEKGYIEAVIALPARLFTMTGISTNIIILSHNNKCIKMVDGTDLFKRGRRFNELEKIHIDKILDALNNETKISKVVTIEDLEKQDYVLDPKRYVVSEELEIENTVEFEKYILNIRRGAPITAKELDDIESKSVTDYQYLMLKNIQNGMVEEDLPYITSVEEKYEKYFIKDGELLLSKIGSPLKAAVAEIKENQKIIANGNLYMIELDKTKVNPYYIQLFLESSKGIAVLNKFTTAGTIPMLSISQLKAIPIPVISMEEQTKLVDEYLAARDNVQYLKNKLSIAEEELKSVYDNYVKGGE